MLLDKVSEVHLDDRTNGHYTTGIQDEIGNRLLEIRKQRDALLSKSIVNLQVNADGIDQARKASAKARAESAAAVKDLGALGGAITYKAIAP